MHESSFSRMQQFARRVRAHWPEGNVRVLDVGSLAVNGSFKEIFNLSGVEYVGLDVESGPNVDFVPKDPYCWRELEDASFDVVISGQALEDVEFPWLVVEQIGRKLKVGGLACLIVPSRGPEHRYPIDCYRFYPDGLRALAKWAGLKVLEVDVLGPKTGFDVWSDAWGDCHCVLTKESEMSAAGAAVPTKALPAAVGGAEGGGRGKHKDNPMRLMKTGFYEKGDRPEVIRALTQQGLKAPAILDLGCSSAAFAVQLKQAVGATRYVAVASSEEAAQRARARLDHVIVADIASASPTDLGFKPGEFDLLAGMDVFEHLVDPWQTLAKWAELLKPGGHLITLISNVQNLEMLKGLIAGRWEYADAGLLDIANLRFFTLETIHKLVIGAGLKVLRTDVVIQPPLDMSRLREMKNTATFDNVTIGRLTRQQIVQLHTDQYIVLAQKPG